MGSFSLNYLPLLTNASNIHIVFKDDMEEIQASDRKWNFKQEFQRIIDKLTALKNNNKLKNVTFSFNNERINDLSLLYDIQDMINNSELKDVVTFNLALCNDFKDPNTIKELLNKMPNIKSLTIQPPLILPKTIIPIKQAEVFYTELFKCVGGEKCTLRKCQVNSANDNTDRMWNKKINDLLLERYNKIVTLKAIEQEQTIQQCKAWKRHFVREIVDQIDTGIQQ